MQRVLEETLPPPGQQLIHMAAEYGSCEILSHLLANDKIEVDSPDGKGRTPLIFSTMNCHVLACELLLRKGADPRIKAPRLIPGRRFGQDDRVQKTSAIDYANFIAIGKRFFTTEFRRMFVKKGGILSETWSEKKATFKKDVAQKSDFYIMQSGYIPEEDIAKTTILFQKLETISKNAARYTRVDNDVRRSVPGKEATFLIHAHNKKGKRKVGGSDRFIVEVQNIETRKLIEDVHIVNNGNGSYRVTYTPEQAGTYRIHIFLDKMVPIKDSPFMCIASYPPLDDDDEGMSNEEHQAASKRYDCLHAADAIWESVMSSESHVFEIFCKALMKECFGFDRVETTNAGADGGVDLVLIKGPRKNTRISLAQCKRYRSRNVTVSEVREFWESAQTHCKDDCRTLTKAYFLTAGWFTGPAIEHAKKKSGAYVLIDKVEARRILGQKPMDVHRQLANMGIEVPLVDQKRQHGAPKRKREAKRKTTKPNKLQKTLQEFFC